uniref:Uncharacterized protein n=3 Tax=Oryza TaxID=4527 RepID=A0A0D3HFS2_9ORYZ
MPVMELGILLIPLTLVFVPCRRIVLFLKRLQEFHRSITHPSFTSADMLSRFSSFNSMALMLKNHSIMQVATLPYMILSVAKLQCKKQVTIAGRRDYQ